jgi:lipopolysaccharide transport system ATP-binding protein
MSPTVIKVENLGKQYRLGVVGTGTISHDLNRFWHRIRGNEDPYLKVGEVNDRSVKGNSDFVWALKNINFSVTQGEVLGVIGKNGAGKSTLLKILSQVTSPSTGQIGVKGRIASLLEVGTGFHPELTGRENIFLNGAILGMTKAEIRSKLDEIVDFAGVEKYIDTPTKRYSSGMVVRLGFAVAAHLEPEILIVDEVLAVGDAEFQKKAIGKMKDVSSQGGRTVLFVSHNMASVKSLCTRGIVMVNGGVAFDGAIDESVNYYLKDGNDAGSTEVRNFSISSESSCAEADIIFAGIRAKGKAYGDVMKMDEEIEFTVQINKKDAACQLDTTLQIKDSSGNYLFASGSGFSMPAMTTGATGLMTYSVTIPANFFNAANFYGNILLVKDRRSSILNISDALNFNVINKQKELGAYVGKSQVPLKPLFPWELIKN